MEKKPNHLIGEKSPYLLQHAYNPVDWYPWGAEAFKKAREENKPILVSIGYSTCHWCHVMERESFENPEIAEIMNQNLVNIKVDREERPDIDKIYMTAVMSIAGSGGWPLNVFLTPELKPFYGGTYFSPQDQMGRVSWPKIVTAISQAWGDDEERQKILETADNFTQNLREFFNKEFVPVPLNAQVLDDAFVSFQSDYDSRLGGFGAAPKFPMPVIHNFLLRYSHYTLRDKKNEGISEAALAMSLDTLRAMAKGGIFDVVGGGFHRYSTDENWHLPHFEKMLYDNAQLALNYLEAYQISKEPFLATVADRTLNYLLRDRAHPDGGFYSAEDADSLEPNTDHKKEGAFYVWSKKEIEKLLDKKEAEIVFFHFNVKEEGNVADWSQEFIGKNILIQNYTPEETASKFGLSVDDLNSLLEKSLEKLFQARQTKPRPGTDDKILTSWNGLAISAFAKGYQVLGEEKYLDAAAGAAQFIQKNLYDATSKTLYRRWREGERNFYGTLEDYAFLAQGLLDLYESTFQVSYLDWAMELTEASIQRFYDSKFSGFYMADLGNTEDLIVHVKEDHDGVEPCGSSISIFNLLRLHAYTNNARYQEIALKCLNFFASRMEQLPSSLPQMLCALYFSFALPKQILIFGDLGADDTRAILKEVYSRFLPNRALIVIDRKEVQEKFSMGLPFIKGCQRIENKATAYICVNQSCQLPTNDLSVIQNLL